MIINLHGGLTAISNLCTLVIPLDSLNVPEPHERGEIHRSGVSVRLIGGLIPSASDSN